LGSAAPRAALRSWRRESRRASGMCQTALGLQTLAARSPAWPWPSIPVAGRTIECGLDITCISLLQLATTRSCTYVHLCRAMPAVICVRVACQVSAPKVTNVGTQLSVRGRVISILCKMLQFRA
jgi:hypothetical protein